jgi:polyhydroxyalkanoate synthase
MADSDGAPSSPKPARKGRKPSVPPEPKKIAAEAPEPPPKEEPTGRGDWSEGFAAQWAQFVNPEQLQLMERLSHNMARAAVSAQGAIAEAALRQAEDSAQLRGDPLNLTPALGEVIGSLASQPDRLLRAQADLLAGYMELWQATARRVADGGASVSVVQPAPGDRRFSDPEWSDNPLFDVMKQSYLLTANGLNGLVSQADGVEPMTRRRVEFFMRMLTDAFSPSNFLLSNPAALREAVRTKGESLAKGMENFAADIERGGGKLKISQTDLSKFKVGENVATAPGKVVLRTELFELLQFEPATPKVRAIPLLIFPPWINKYYILDLRAENSMIRWLAGLGFTVFVVSWVNPAPELARKTFEDYMLEGVFGAVDAVLQQTGQKQVNAVGYCIAGTMLSCALAYAAAKGDERIASATFFAAQQDFSEAGDLRLFTDEDWLRVIETQMSNAGGVLPADAMADTFNVLRANDLIWSYFVNNYLLGKEAKPFDLLFWNADQTRMPRALHLFYLRQFYQANALAEGRLELGGELLDLRSVKVPVFAQAGKDDHIAPARSVYRGARLFGGPVKYVLAGSGHIAGVINHPDAKKYQHWTNDHLPASLDGWMTGAKEHPGSWWPTWAAWLSERSGATVPARNPAKGPLAPLEEAPGSYVMVKS